LMNRKILVIEDDPAGLRLVGYTLKKQGYEVVTASNGLEGLKKAREEGPDLVILDLMLPGVDGFEICHRLRTEPQTARLPILVLSGKTGEADRDTALKVGANAYLVKPASPSEVIKQVESLLARKAAPGQHADDSSRSTRCSR
ncbi:MAG: response regulator, partial [Chloroflexota bacterium]|nr:response regulator [Chloroflexota bacterium]